MGVRYKGRTESFNTISAQGSGLSHRSGLSHPCVKKTLVEGDLKIDRTPVRSPERLCKVSTEAQVLRHRGKLLKPKRLKRKDRSLLWIGPNPTEDLCLRRGLNFSPARTLLFSMALESVFQVAVELHSSPPPLGNTEYLSYRT